MQTAAWRITVCKNDGGVCLSHAFGLLHGVRLSLDCIPSVGDAHLLQGVTGQFLYMKAAMVRMALRELCLAMGRMELDISMVCSLTISLLSSSIRISVSMTVPADTPFMMAMIVPLPPRGARLVTTVYNSPLLGAVSSMQRLSPMFSGNTKTCAPRGRVQAIHDSRSISPYTVFQTCHRLCGKSGLANGRS